MIRLQDVSRAADQAGVTVPILGRSSVRLARPRLRGRSQAASQPAYVVLEWTNHYRVHGGQVRRDAIARRTADGALRVVSFRTEAVA